MNIKIDKVNMQIFIFMIHCIMFHIIIKKAKGIHS